MKEVKKLYLGKTANGYDTYAVENSQHMLAHPVAKADLIEAVGKIEYVPTFWIGTVDLGRVVGKNACVEVTAEDDVREECRPGRELPSRVVYGREMEDTTLMTVGICTDEDDGLVTVFTAFAGPKAPRELSDPRLTEEERPAAEAFWRTHALVVG